MRLMWKELGIGVRASIMASVFGGALGLLSLASSASNSLRVLTLPSSIDIVPGWLLFLVIFFSLTLGGLVSVLGSMMLLLRPINEDQRRGFAFSILALSMIVLFLTLPIVLLMR